MRDPAPRWVVAARWSVPEPNSASSTGDVPARRVTAATRHGSPARSRAATKTTRMSATGAAMHEGRSCPAPQGLPYGCDAKQEMLGASGEAEPFARAGPVGAYQAHGVQSSAGGARLRVRRMRRPPKTTEDDPRTRPSGDAPRTRALSVLRRSTLGQHPRARPRSRGKHRERDNASRDRRLGAPAR